MALNIYFLLHLFRSTSACETVQCRELPKRSSMPPLRVAGFAAVTGVKGEVHVGVIDSC